MHVYAASCVTSANIHPKSMCWHIYTLKTHKDDPKRLEQVEKTAKNSQKQPKTGPKQLKHRQK